MRFWCALAVSTFVLASCSKAAEDPSPATSLVREIPAESLSDATKLKDDAHLKCQDRNHCPTNVGLFLATKPDGVLSCTAFLVEDDVIATNSHCVPFEVQNLPDLCSARISVIFAGTAGKPEEKFACAEFLGSSPRPNAQSPDLALFRLQAKTARPPFRIDRSGVAPDSLYEALKVNPAPGASGTLVHAECKAVNRSYRFSLYERASDPIFTVGDCRSVPGNSGSPLLNAEGAAVGILQTDLTVTSEQMKKVWGAHLLPGEEFAPLALGTSLRCLTATNRFSLDPSCPPIDDQAIPRPRIDELLPPGGEAAAAALAPFTEKLPAGLRWDTTLVRSQALLREESLQPVCFRAPGPWLDDFAILSEPGRYLEEARLEADLPVLEAKLFFNRYLQVSAKYSLKFTELATLSFSPESLVRRGRSEVKLGDKELNLNYCLEP
jgi:Trypsin-like peptidase domain